MSRTFGTKGLAFSRRIAATAAWTRALSRGQLGAVGQGDDHEVVQRAWPGSISVTWAWSCSSGSTTARGSSRRTWVRLALCDPPLLAGRRTARCSRSARRFRGAVDLDPRDQVLAQSPDPVDQVLAPLDGVERAGVGAPGTGGRRK